MLPLLGEEDEKSFQIEVVDESPRVIKSGAIFNLKLRIQNNAAVVLGTEGANPIYLSYHWLNPDGSIAWFDGERTKLVPALQPGAAAHYLARIQSPTIAGDYKLQPALVQEGVRWFDRFDSIRFEVQEDRAVTPNPEELCRRESEKAFNEGNRAKLIEALSKLDGTAVDEDLIRFADNYLSFIHSGKKKIASVDPNRRPNPPELIITFGNYPYSFGSLAVNNPMRRNILEFWNFTFDEVEFEECWASVDRIFVINRDDRVDRWYSCLRELARMGAPLNRVSRFSACIDRSTANRQLNGAIGCLRSHLSVMQMAKERGFDKVLVLEDDFGFTDEIELNKVELKSFFQRSYNFDVCLLATSRHGLIVPKDDLVAITRQPCTNAGAYIASKTGVHKLVTCFSQALDQLISTGDHQTYAADRCWSSLQERDKFLVFKRRLGLQLPSFSDIQEKIAAPFD